MKLLFLLPLSFACLFIVGCNGHQNGTTAKTTDSTQYNTAIPLSSIHADSATHTAPTKAEPVEQEVLDEDHLEKMMVTKETGGMWLTANIRLDWRIFGYNKPDSTSKKMMLLSVFTSDVEGNPYNCPYGSYYETGDHIDLKYIATEGAFIKANIITTDSQKGTVYIDKKWVEFE